MKQLKKKYFLLLEVLVATALVVFAVLPLIAPHFYIYREQRSFIDNINLDIAVNQFYAHIVEKLYRNEFGWIEVEERHRFPIDENFLNQIGYRKPFPFDGSFHFAIVRNKENQKENYKLYHVQLLIDLAAKNRAKGSEKPPMHYEYDLFIARLLS